MERAGSSIDGGPPLSCAAGHGQWVAARRLVERSARTLLWHEAALGPMPAIKERVETDPPPQPEELSGPFWNACHGGQLAVAQYLLPHGADLNWDAALSSPVFSAGFALGMRGMYIAAHLYGYKRGSI